MLSCSLSGSPSSCTAFSSRQHRPLPFFLPHEQQRPPPPPPQSHAQSTAFHLGRCPSTPTKRALRPIHANASSGPASEEDEWLLKLPEKKKPLYSHSLPCIEAWLKTLGFVQTKEDRATWTIERPDWHARLSLDVTDLFIRYLKSGPGNLDRDIERKFSYALSREDLENAILGGP